MTKLLETKDLCKYFGGLRAVDGVDMGIDEGRILGIIGPNGAGKTTVFNLIMGYYKPTRGEIKLNGERIDGLEPHRIVRKGIARTFQIVRPFTGLSVLENVLVAYGHRYYARSGSLWGRYGRASHEALEILGFTGLARRKDLPASTLPIGFQRRLEIARGLALNPALLLLDEPAAGLTEVEIAELKGLIRNIVEAGITVTLVEHRMSFVMDICENIIVLDQGKRIAEGDPETVANDPEVIEAYLGSKEGEDAED
ncbi:MAG: ABC transporter ATP-binding protein [Candidatus Bipolaricaulota bacterium]|nr:ABC transporter ATP-binding protein [Candidatus Bipolaricaulota bacterium]